MGLDVDYDYSPNVWRKIVYSSTRGHSFDEASQHLLVLAEIEVSPQRVHRASLKIGQERLAEREQEIVAFQALTLPEQQASPLVTAPQVACVEMDGGRLQMRERLKPDEENPEEERDGLWHELKGGLLLSMESEVSTEDPCPLLPATFVDPARMSEIAREIKGVSGESPSVTTADQPPEKSADDRPGRPKPLVKSVVATCAAVGFFGPLLAAAAWARGFAGAARKAFVADGLAVNWGVWRKYFSHYTPILDFVHALCYVYAAAMAARTTEAGWAIYRQWAQLVWSGQVDFVIAALELRQQEVGLPAKDDAKTLPRKVIADTLGYLRNQRTRMKYDEYRKQGLPITSSNMESTIKQLHRRMKGTEKFWAKGAEPMLVLVADQLCETQAVETFWRSRPERINGQRTPQTAAA